MTDKVQEAINPGNKHSTRNPHTFRVGLFVGDTEDAITVRRGLSLQAAGCSVMVFGFTRNWYRLKVKRHWRTISLGTIKARRYMSRSIRLLRALSIIVKNRQHFPACHRLYARNLDMALLALFARCLLRSNSPLTYEVLDIVPILHRRNMTGAVMRYLERIVLRSCDELLVSSPAFVEGYFALIQKYSGRWVLIENKIPASYVEGVQRPRLKGKAKSRETRSWRIGWFGTLRSEESLMVLAQAAQALKGRLTVEVWGVFTGFPTKRANEIIEAFPFIHYYGPYSAATDLPSLYEKIDFMWCGDLGIIDPFNDRLLRPNRLYEAAFFGVPQIGVRDSETATRIENDGLGWVLPDASVESLVAFMEEITESDCLKKVHEILSLPSSRFVESNEIEDLVRHWVRVPSE